MVVPVAADRAPGAGRVSRPRPSAARQIREQRRLYARAVLRSLARSHTGRPAAQIHQVLRTAFRPLGVRLSPAALQGLALDIAAGRPVELP